MPEDGIQHKLKGVYDIRSEGEHTQAFIKFERDLMQGLATVKTTGEVLGHPNQPLTKTQYDEAAKKMQSSYMQKYGMAHSVEGKIPYHAHFDLTKVNTSEDISDQEYQEVSARSAAVLDELKLYPVITSRAPLMASLREAYTRVTDPTVRADVVRVFELTSFDLHAADASEMLMDCLIDSEQTPEKYLVVFTKLLSDERQADETMKPVIEHSQEMFDQIKRYCAENNIPLKLPDPTGIVYARSLESFTPTGNVIEQDFERGPAAGVTHSPETRLDPNKSHFVVKTAWLGDNFDMSEATLQKKINQFVTNVVHEAVHQAGEHPEGGDWEEAANEAMTDYTSVMLITRGTKAPMFDKFIPEDWVTFSGYRQLTKLALLLTREGVIDPDELIQFGINQNYPGFVEKLDHELAVHPEKSRNLIDELDRNYVFGPNQYEKLIANLDGFSAKDIFKATLEFRDEVGNFNYGHPGVLLRNVQDFVPEMKGKPPGEFSDWICGTSRDRSNEEMRKRRHQAIKSLINFVKEKNENPVAKI